jgi:N-acetylglucosaminyldiphosphoundecaprenol N-acetyl-beta-D-mannosaminyltransferase
VRVELLGSPLDALDMPATVDRCLDLIENAERPARQVSLNAAKVVESARDDRMRRFIRESDVVSADGQSVVWAARLLGRPVPERVAGIDLMHELLGEAAKRGLTVYLLGAREEVLRTASGRLLAMYPGLRLAGATNGYFEAGTEQAVADEIRDSGAHLLFVAMSSPMKERWLDSYLEQTGVRFGMGVGGALDVLAGERERAPRWAQRVGLEWAFRMAQEPTRMWRRYLVGNARFLWLVARELIRRGRSSEVSAR